MNILSLTRKEVEYFVSMGSMDKTDLFHYDVCAEIARGRIHSEIAEKFNIPDIRHVRYIKANKCKECPTANGRGKRGQWEKLNNRLSR